MENNQTPNNNIDVEKLQQAKEELEAVCKKYNISLVPVIVHQGERTFSSVEIVPTAQQPVQNQVEPTLVQ